VRPLIKKNFDNIKMHGTTMEKKLSMHLLAGSA